MSISVVFYYTGKKHNSTAQPDSGGRTVNCELKYPCSIMSPVIRVNRGRLMDADPEANPPLPSPQHRYNYCYIADFERYYFASDIIEDGPFMEYRLQCDVLASFKSDILGTTQFVMRTSSSAYIDGTITDNLYPCTADLTFDSETISSSGWNPSILLGGMWSIGVAVTGQTCYYLMEPLEAGMFFASILNDSFLTATLSDVSLTLYPQLKMMVDPLQYITSLVWIPYAVTTTSMASAASIKIGYTDVTVGGNTTWQIQDPVIQRSFTFSGSRKQHPAAATRGKYLNCGPYTETSIYIPGFGLVPISATEVANSSGLGVTYNIDIRTGTATADVVTSDKMLTRLTAQIGIPVQLSQVHNPGNGMNLISSAIGVLGSAFTGNFLGVAQGIASGVGDAIKNEIPTANTIGSMGGAESLEGDITLYYTFHDITWYANQQFGSPCCQNVTLSSLSGFCLCSPQAWVTAPATEAEYDQIIRYLTTGFYIE